MTTDLPISELSFAAYVSGRNPSRGAGRPSADLVNAASEIERAYRQIVVRAVKDAGAGLERLGERYMRP